MFFTRYLLRELRRRMRQAIVIGLGLALGVGLVITVTAASAGVSKAQSDVLHSLYGLGTDITVTTKPPKAKGMNQRVGPSNGKGSGGPGICINGSCSSGAGSSIDNLTSQAYGAMSTSTVATVDALAGVKEAAGGLLLNDTQITLPKQGSNSMPQPKTFTVAGVDLAHLGLGPISNSTVESGRTFTAADADAYDALVDANYATANGIKTGDTIKVGGKKFRVIGVVTQPQGANPPEVYLPLARAQALAKDINGNALTNKINTVYVKAANASAISAVRGKIRTALPSATVTTSSELASQVTGSLSSTAKLANILGRWLAVLVLIAAFAVAALLTMAAVARRVREFGTLKALGWRTRRIIAQVMGESLTMGVFGGALGVGLGYLGAAIITHVAPTLSATLPSSGGKLVTNGPGGQSTQPPEHHTISVPLHAVVAHDSLVLAVALAVLGGLIAGAFASWRIARLRPVEALARVA